MSRYLGGGIGPWDLEDVPLYWINRILTVERLEQQAAEHQRRQAERQARAEQWQRERLGV